MAHSIKWLVSRKVFVGWLNQFNKKAIPCLLVIGGGSLILLAICANAALAAGPGFDGELMKINGSCASTTHTAIRLFGNITPEGVATTWRFEVSRTQGGPWKIVEEGTITLGEAEKLQPEEAISIQRELAVTSDTVEFVRFSAEQDESPSVKLNEELKNNLTSSIGCEPVPLYPTPQTDGVKSVTATSVHVEGLVEPNLNASEINWCYEYITVSELQAAESRGEAAKWIVGPCGAISQMEAEAAPLNGPFPSVVGDLTGLKAGTAYDVRLSAENKLVKEELPSNVVSFETSGPPTVDTFPVHAFDGEALRIIGAIRPNNSGLDEIQTITVGGSPTGGTFTLAFKGEATNPIPSNAESVEVSKALEALPSIGVGNVLVEGSPGGPYSVEFFKEMSSSGESVLVGDGSGLVPSGAVSVAVVQTGFSYPTHYHFEYVAKHDFEVDGWVKAVSTAVGEVAGTGQVVVGEDLVGLQAGEEYRYRLVGSNTTPGSPVVDGVEQAFVVPSVVGEGGGGVGVSSCSNEEFRTGLSAQLPDCRAYEQVTPVDKEGAQEVFHYGPTSEGAGALVGEDGEHVMIGSPETKYGTGPGSGQSPYFFTRGSTGWSMVSASPQPETGVNRITVKVVLSPDLTEYGFESLWQTAPDSQSPKVELKLGVPGGPYTTVATIPRALVGEGWVASSANMAKVILQVEDHDLLGSPTGTTQGEDIYEYSHGVLHQVNVDEQGTIGTCGAHVVKGQAEPNRGLDGGSSNRAVSVDGSRVFFEAVPGSDCSGVSHLYMREAEANHTLDIGEYKFMASNADGTQLLLERAGKLAKEPNELIIYEVGSGNIRVVSSHVEEQMAVSSDFTALYFASAVALTPEAPRTESGVTDLYRYDIGSGGLRFVAQAVFAQYNGHGGPSPDGRYYYFAAEKVFGVPGGVTGFNSEAQVYRFDNDESVVECMSCASSFAREPKLEANFAGYGLSAGIFGNDAADVPEASSFSADGDYAFFDTASALVPGDIDGEIAPEKGGTGFVDYSPSSDVYEWRRVGVGGCVQLDGCLSLISSGRGGYKVLLLGTADEGRDVFFSDFSQLVPADNDTAGDIYDARIGGGFPEPVKVTECEGDACSTPASPPVDSTPSSFTFTGPGNQIPPVTPSVKPKAKPKKCSKSKRLSHGKCVKAKSKKQVKRAKKKLKKKSVGSRG